MARIVLVVVRGFSLVRTTLKGRTTILVIARHASAEAISAPHRDCHVGACPEHYEILRFTQNDNK
jgi:hypothetical protein